jgi:hypothetical protein
LRGALRRFRLVRSTIPQNSAKDALRSTAHPLTGSARDYDPLLNLIGEARVVLLGEVSIAMCEA